MRKPWRLYLAERADLTDQKRTNPRVEAGGAVAKIQISSAIAMSIIQHPPQVVWAI